MRLRLTKPGQRLLRKVVRQAAEGAAAAGVGSHLAVADLNRDGAIDIITSTNRGAFIFWNQMHAAKRATGKKQVS
jgi:hypothetical protein